MSGKSRPNNRLLVLCTSINDVTAWPFWKFLQMKKIKGVTDMALLAFNSDGGSFEARIDGDKYSMKNYAKVKGYRQEMFQSFLERWHDPGRSYFVYGGHGMGDYLEFEQYKFGLQVHELARLLGKKYFEAILFDACFMANLDCAYHLRHNTRYIGACEGYMWEPDTALDFHIFNTFTASAMSRFRDPKLILETIQKEYTSKAPRGDFSVLDTTHAAELRRFVAEHVMQRVYNRATLYSPQQQERLSLCAERAIETSIREFGQPGGDDYLEGLLTRKHPATAPTTPDAFALANSGRLTRKQRVAMAVQFEHSLYPSEALDKHLVDLRSYLVDMAVEEDTQKEGDTRRGNGRRRPVRKAAAGAWSPSRAYDVDAHGTYPPERTLSPNEAPPALENSSNSSSSGRGGTAASASSSAGAGAAASGEGKGIASAYPPDSARYGLDLLNSVVVSHVPPRSEGIYASRLGGLSVAVHEYSAMSKPVEPWKVSKTILNKKTKAFLARGSLEEVHMRREAGGAPPQQRLSISPTQGGRQTAPSQPPAVKATTTGTDGARGGPVTSASSRIITCHQSPAPAPEQSMTDRSSTSLTTGAAVAAAAAAAAATASANASTRSASSSQSSSFLVSSSAYSSLSSRSRFYASYRCGHHHQHLRHHPNSSFPPSSSPVSAATSPPSSSSSSSSLSSLEGTGGGGGCRGDESQGSAGFVPRSRSADEVREIQRMAMEAAQLLDSTNRY